MDDARGEAEELSLEQFAGISAAVADGIALDEVLRQEQVDPAAWPKLERKCRERISARTADHLAFMRSYRVAQDCLERAIAPLDEDVEVWSGFLNALATSDEPAAVLASVGVTSGDVDRLGRMWKQRAQADAELARRMQNLPPVSAGVPKVTIGPARLRPFPWTPSARRERPPSDAEPMVLHRVQASYQLNEHASMHVMSADLEDITLLPEPGPGNAALPFVAGTSAPPEAAPLADQSGETMMIGVDPRNATMPFSGGSGWLALLKVDRYAEMAAELRARPEDSDDIMTRFGLLPDARMKLHDLWRIRFESNPPLRQSFERLVAEKVAAIKRK